MGLSALCAPWLGHVPIYFTFFILFFEVDMAGVQTKWIKLQLQNWKIWLCVFIEVSQANLEMYNPSKCVLELDAWIMNVF